MSTWLGWIMGIATLICGYYTSCTARQKGPILSNTYIWLSKEERKHVDKKAEYHLVTVIFGGLTGYLLMNTIYIFTSSTLFLIIGFLFLAFDMIYAIVDAVRTNRD